MRGSKLWALIALAFVACSESGGGGRSSARSESPTEADLCKEHGVLEAVCTKCDPALIAVFRAKGDFCEEHGFPESFCPICHPEAGGRPRLAVSADDAPPDGMKVRFKKKGTAQLAGIKTATAERRPGGARLFAPATIVFDATRRAEVNARTSGVMKTLLADVGQRVKANAALAVLESAEIGGERARIAAAASRVKIAEANAARERRLAEKGISTEQSVLEAQQTLESARAELAAASSALGMVDARTDGLGRVTIFSPIEGSVLRRTVTIGELVDAGDPLFELADTRVMWAEIDVAEAELGVVETGQRARLVIDALPDATFTGTIAHVAAELDPKTRTVKARAAIANPRATLRANMFARAEIELGEARASVTIPRNAMQTVKKQRLVFVRTGDEEFEVRRITTGVESGAFVEVLRGLEPGEAIATDGSYLLKTETLKDSIGAGCCD